MSFARHLGFDDARCISQVHRLLCHEYGFVFFLGERVICQHSPHNQLLTPAFPPFTMRRHATTPVGEREALVEGIQYHFFVMDMPYQVFATTYLLDEVPSVYSLGYI